jgi:hypothetical protein
MDMDITDGCIYNGWIQRMDMDPGRM